MKWVRHQCLASEDEFLSDLLAKHGLEGYGRFWLLVEAIGSRTEMGEKDSTVRLPWQKWRDVLRGRQKAVENFLRYLEGWGKVTLTVDGDGCAVAYPNIIKYRDEYAERKAKEAERLGREQGENSDSTPKKSDNSPEKTNFSAKKSHFSEAKAPSVNRFRGEVSGQHPEQDTEADSETEPEPEKDKKTLSASCGGGAGVAPKSLSLGCSETVGKPPLTSPIKKHPLTGIFKVVADNERAKELDRAKRAQSATEEDVPPTKQVPLRHVPTPDQQQEECLRLIERELNHMGDKPKR